ncbi:MAG: DNRLRE domain-containing protein, partial [Byssovorax sp.]
MNDKRIQEHARSTSQRWPQGERGPLGARRLGALGTTFAALTSLLSIGLAGPSGCGDTIDSSGQRETAGQRETLGEAKQADSTPVTCINLQRGTSKVFDTFVSSEKPSNNYGGNTAALVGQAAGGVDRFYALFKFDTSPIPANATITSANVALFQVAATPGTWNAHLITAPWTEATVTWNSFGSAFNLTTFKSVSTATQAVVFSVTPQLQAWVSGTLPNHGFLIEMPGAAQTKIKSAEWPIANAARPYLAACYQVTCAPSFADCNGLGADGCEADLHSTATCGSCGTPCALPHATASCSTGTCAIGSCDLGFGDCDGNAANGCETDL